MKFDIRKYLAEKPKDGKPRTRAAQNAAPHVDRDKRTVSMSYSSEFPVERKDWMGDYYEILGHQPNEINTERMATAPFLHVHDHTQQLGAVVDHKSPATGERCNRADVKISRSPEGDKYLNDAEDGIAQNISVGYDVHEAREVGLSDVHPDDQKHIKRNIPIIRVTKWTPMEISDAPVPADHTVGAGRTGREVPDPELVEENPEEFVDAFDSNGKQLFEEDGVTPKKVKVKSKKKEVGEMTPEEKSALEVEIKKRAHVELMARTKQIRDIAEKFKDNEKIQTLAREFEVTDKPIHEFQTQVLELAAVPHRQVETGETKIGMDAGEIRKYSMTKAIMMMARAMKGGGKFEGLEKEASDATAKKLGRSAEGFFVPMDILRSPIRYKPSNIRGLNKQRDLTTQTGPLGGFGVETEVMAQDFIELLRNRIIFTKLGAMQLTGLEGNLAIPKQTGASTAYWVGENASVSESDQALGQIGMTPHQLRVSTNYSKQLLEQSSLDVEMFVRDDQAKVIALALDLAALNGSGNNGQPLGLLNSPGLSVVSLGTNGGTATYANLLTLKKNVAAANADFGNLGFLTSAAGRFELEETLKISGSGFPVYLWDDRGQDADGVPIGDVIGYKAYVSNQVPINLVKGSLSTATAILFGNFENMILASWGILDVVVNPYSLDTSGEIRVTMGTMADVACRYIPGFSAILDQITT